MDRSTVYTSEQGRSVDFLFAQRATMIGLAKLSQAALGSSTIVRGLSVTPNSPAALNVLVGIGEIYSMVSVDATPYGSLAADTTDVILKQGLNMTAQTMATPAPTTTGYSVVYLIEAQYQDQDTNSAVLPFFNSANPQLPLNGQGGNGLPLATQRQGVCVIQVKAGVPAATGSQVAPSVDAGWTALATVTVANGQSTVTSSNIAIPAGVPQVSSLLQMMQNGSTSYAIDSSTTPNQVTVALSPPITAYVDGQPINFQASNNNTGACTINAGPGSVSLTGSNGAFQGGEIVAGKFYEAVYRANTGSVVVIGQSGGALQVPPATQSQQAAQLGQVVGVVGSARNLLMSVPAASSTASLTADEIVVETALGGIRYCLPSFNKNINLTTVGAGGMDVGTAPLNGFVALYAIYNPTTGASALLARNATSSAQPNVYGGGNMPAGYTASALVGVWPTNGSGQFSIGCQRDRRLSFPNITVLSSSTLQGSFAALSISGAVPANATNIIVTMGSVSNTTGTVQTLSIAADANGSGGQALQSGCVVASNASFCNGQVQIITPQTVYWKSATTGGTVTFFTTIAAYDI